MTGICHKSHKGIRYNCHVRVPFFITDEMDLAKTITGMFASSQGKRPCNICDCLFSSDVTVLGNLRDYIKLREVHNIVTFKLTSPATCRRWSLRGCLTTIAKSILFTPKWTCFFICLALTRAKIQAAGCMLAIKAFSKNFWAWLWNISKLSGSL